MSIQKAFLQHDGPVPISICPGFRVDRLCKFINCVLLNLLTTLLVVNTVGHTIYEGINSQNIGDNTVGAALFQLTVYNIRGLCCRAQYFNWMENSVHLRDFQQSEIRFICVLPGQF